MTDTKTPAPQPNVAVHSSIVGSVLDPQNDDEHCSSEARVDAAEMRDGIDARCQEQCVQEAFCSPAHIDPTSCPTQVPIHVRDFLGKVQGVCMGVAMSGQNHPDPDGALLELVYEAQEILFPAALPSTEGSAE